MYEKRIEYYLKKTRCLLSDDSKYIADKYFKKHGTYPDLVNPQTLNEKIMYRMLHGNDKLFTRLSDKVNVRIYVALNAGIRYLVPLYCIYTKARDINFSDLPESFVLKCNHDSGSTIVVKHKKYFRKERALSFLQFRLDSNFYYKNRESHYRAIAPVIICEKYMPPVELPGRNMFFESVRLHCFNGRPRFIEADFISFTKKDYVNIYTTNWRLLPFTIEYGNTPFEVEKPDFLQEALDIAVQLSGSIDYCRVDLLVTAEGLFFSEMTFTPYCGRGRITPICWDKLLGKLWKSSAESTHC
ncbi:glycosyl transferase [Enterobacter bugandensis]|nr:glycosyl transferase [Enterobacter bugandensis]